MLLAALLLAQAAPQCPQVDATLPASLDGWKWPEVFPEGEAKLTIGMAATLPVAPSPVGAAGPHRFALAPFHIAKAGIYSVSLDQKGWIDVLPAGSSVPLKSVSHREGDPCWSIRKIVRFELAAGDYALSVKDPQRDAVQVLVSEGE